MANKMKWLAFLGLLLPAVAFGQLQKYNYNRPLGGITGTWHDFEIPDPMFGKMQPDFSDLRIYGFTEAGDTVEAPYIVDIHEERAKQENIRFRLVYQYHWKGAYYFCFEVPNGQSLNEIELDIPSKNFDWKVELEGSDNNLQYTKVIDRYRIVSVSNADLDYHFTTIRFPIVKYRYLRIRIPDAVMDDEPSALLFRKEIFRGRNKEYTDFITEVSENKDQKRTEILLTLPRAVPVSYLKIPVDADYDYYRKFTIQYAYDSVKTQNGYENVWRDLSSGVLSSLEDKEYKFSNTITWAIRVLVRNNDNQPLKFGAPELKGDIHTVTARFTEPAEWLLAYGNPYASAPNYDIDLFVNRIPEDMTPMTLGAEVFVGESGPEPGAPLFENPLWLWVIMGVVILLLGFFTFSMMNSKKMEKSEKTD